MEIKKLLYVTDAPGAPARTDILLPLCRLGMTDILFVVPERGTIEDNVLRKQGVNTEILPVNNVSVSAILAKAGEASAAMIAADLKREDGRVSNRSLLKGLIQTSPVPLLFIPPHEPAEKAAAEDPLFRSVVFGVDRDNLSERLMDFVLDLEDLIRELEIVNVIDRKLSIRDMIEIKKLLEGTRGVFLDRGTDAEVHLYAGKPAREIMLAAKDYRAKSIIIGAGRPSGWKRLFKKSCCQEVAEETRVPTFIIP